jgi:orotidine-5'-phosphate decarboxylase
MPAGGRLIVALDTVDATRARQWADAVAPHAGLLKLGLEFFLANGSAGFRGITGAPIFLDLKLHDIPNTVEGAARSAAATGAALLTVHASGGPEMIRAAVRGAGEQVKVLAVTVLTSLDAATLDRIGLEGPPEAAVVRLARLAVEAGAGGLVCSPQEVAAVRAAVGSELLLVVPGVRPAGAAAGDQSRIATPAEAVRAGADVIVVGRPLRDADDPADAARRIAAELQSA